MMGHKTTSMNLTELRPYRVTAPTRRVKLDINYQKKNFLEVDI